MKIKNKTANKGNITIYKKAKIYNFNLFNLIIRGVKVSLKENQIGVVNFLVNKIVIKRICFTLSIFSIGVILYINPKFAFYSNIINNGKQNISAADKLIKDQHPTNLEVERLEIQNIAGVNEPYVVAIIKNISTVTATSVQVKFFTPTGKSIQGLQSINKLYKVKNLAIRAGQEQVIPVAPISQYLAAIYPEKPDAEIIGFASPDQPINQLVLQEKVCSSIKENFSSCNYDSLQRSVAIKINYGSIFDEKMTLLTQMVNIALTGQVRVS
jgi:hypothetical protein